LDYFNSISAYYAGNKDAGFASVRALIEQDEISQGNRANAISNSVFYGAQMQALTSKEKRKLLFSTSRAMNGMLGSLNDGCVKGFQHMYDICKFALFEKFEFKPCSTG
jgi:hypothetical protein